jgi:hypothetical protein
MNTNIIHVSLATIIFLAGFGIGWSIEHDKLTSYKATVVATGHAQELVTKQKEKENDEQTKLIADSYSTAVLNLRAKLDRLQHSRTGGGSVSKATNDSKGINETGEEPSRACQSTEFYGNAVEDAQQIEFIHNWVIREGIPVEE